MSHLNPGLISAYNSLTDKHLAGYFSNTRIRRHLQRAGLITRSGRIVPDKEYRHRLTQRQHQRHVRECLAQAIFHKVLEMERAHQTEIKRRLEEFAKRERVHKIKSERSNRYEEDFVRILSPCPPTGARVNRKQRSAPEGDRSESSESPGSSRPNTAPGKMQRPVRLKPIHSNRTMAALRRSSPYHPLDSSNETEPPPSCTMESHRRLTGLEASRGISPYCLPVINTFVTPVPPPTKRKDLGLKGLPSSAHRGRRLRPSTLSSAKVNEDPPMLRSSVLQSRVSVNMIYFGKKVHLSHDLHDTRDEVKVFQQHCGGENLCIYKGLLHGGEMFQFTSRRHRGYPFSLTFFLNGLQVERLSSCCEFKHRRASRLGGRHRHFGFCSVEGASPCYKCILAMGLDKHPTPPPKRVREDRKEEPIISMKLSPDTAVTREDEILLESSQPGDAETLVREGLAAMEGKARDGYEEDFEADDEGPPDDGDTQEKTSLSPQSQTKDTNVSETEDDGNDEDITSHRSSSSSSTSDREDSEAETDTDRPKESNHEEPDVPEERAQPNPEETSEAELKDTEVENSAADGTEIHIPDSTGPSGTENELSADTSGDTDESKQEEELERAKSVQEKLAEAVMKESQYSSEPELSDTSTEDEEDVQKCPERESKEEPVVVTEQEPKFEKSFEKESTVQAKEEMSGDKMKEKQEEDIGDTKDTAEETPAEFHPPEEEENISQHPGSENKMEEKSSENGEDEVAKDVEHADVVGQEAKSSEEDESSRSVPNEKAENETAVEDNVEAGEATAAETMEMKVELSEEREALSCEEAPVADAEDRPREDGEDKAATPDTEISTGNKEGVLEESGGAAVKTGAEASGDPQSLERDNKEEAAEEEEIEQSVQTHDEVESEGKDEEKQADPDEIGDRNSSEERREEDNETKTDSNVGRDEKEQGDTADGKTDQSPKTNEGEDCECVKDGNKEEEKEVIDVCEKTSEMCEEVKNDEIEEIKVGHGTEGGEHNTRNCEKEEEGGISSADELRKNTDAGSAEDMKKPEGSTVETEDEAANIEVQETVRKASGKETENGEIDAEDREFSFSAERRAQRDAAEAGTEAQNDAEAAKHTVDTIKIDEATEEERTGVENLTAESGDDGTEKHKCELKDPTADAGSVKSDVKDEESTGDGPGAEIKGTELEESCNIPEESNEGMIREVLTEVTTEQSLTLVPLDTTARKVDVSVEMTEVEEHPLSAVRGESGETEASKASEEGTSVVLNPRASFPDKEECPAAHPEIREIIDAEENVDLVSNWVTTHQVARFFETFVEPLDDLKEEQAEVTQHDQCAAPLCAVTSVKMVDGAGQEKTKEEATEAERESDAFQTSETSEKDPVKDEVQVQEETEVMDLLLEEPSEKEITQGPPAGSEGRRTSLQNGGGEEGFVQNTTEQDRASTPGARDGTGSHHSVARGSSGHHTEQEDPDLDTKATPVEEFRGLQAPAEAQHHSQRSTPEEETSRLNGHQPQMLGANEKGPEGDFTWARPSVEPEESVPQPPDTSVGGEEPDLQLTPDLLHSKERLSVPSVNETNFPRSSYPLLASVTTQNGQ